MAHAERETLCKLQNYVHGLRHAECEADEHRAACYVLRCEDPGLVTRVVDCVAEWAAAEHGKYRKERGNEAKRACGES